MAGWPGDTEMAEATGTDPMSRISCLSKVCLKYGSTTSWKCQGVGRVNVPLSSSGYATIALTKAATICGVLTMCQSRAGPRLIISIPHKVHTLVIPSFHVRGNRSTEKLRDLPKVTRQAVELALNSDALTPEPARTPCLARSPPAAVVTDFF